MSGRREDLPSAATLEERIRWRQVRRLLAEVAARPPERRAAFLAKACDGDGDLKSEVESLLASYDEAGTTFLGALAPDGDGADPEQVGPYLLTDVIGQGGMGTVYRAVRADDVYRHPVAIKLIKPGWASSEVLRRFRSERQILAELDHPHIARLLDGGETPAGAPYLVMEYVVGQPIDEYCDTHGLSTAQRVAMMHKVCSAVQYAHQNLVVHRDLKPSNILVTEQGEPKLVDFGIAKLLSPASLHLTIQATSTGWTPMTPQYASPEQVCGEPVTTASDAYSLGVVLYEVLTGHRPYYLGDGRLQDLVDAVCRRQPERPSSVVRQEVEVQWGARHLRLTPKQVSAVRDGQPRQLYRRLRGDLDHIVLKALRKEPRHRYASAEQLADDLERFLSGHPVRARRGTWLYRGGKFVRRYRWAVSAAALTVAVLVGLVAGLLVQRQQILRERNLAQEVSNLLLEVFTLPDPTRARGKKVAASELLDGASAAVAERFPDDPELRSALLGTLGRTYGGLGLLHEGIDVLAGAVALDRGSGRRDLGAAERLHHLAELLRQAGRYSEAESVGREALELRRRLLDDDDPRIAMTLSQLAKAVISQARFDEAETYLAEALELARRGGDRVTLAEVLNRYGGLEQRRGRYGEAERLFEEALELHRRSYGGDHPDVAEVLNDLAAVIAKRDPEAALALYRQAEAMERRLFDGPHPALATTLTNQAVAHSDNHRFEQAEALYREAEEIQRQVYAGPHAKLASTLCNLAATQFHRGDHAAADATYREAVEMYEEELGAGHPDTANCLNNHAQVLRARGELEAAEAAFTRVLATFRATLGYDHDRVAVLLNNLADVAVRRGELGRARELFEESIRIMRSTLGDEHRQLGGVLYNYALLLERLGEAAAALGPLRDAAAIYRASLGEDAPHTARVEARLALLELGLGHFAAAERRAAAALPALADGTSAGDTWWAVAKRTRGLALLRSGRSGEAVVELEAAVAAVEAIAGAHPDSLRQGLEALAEAYDAQGRADAAEPLRARLRSMDE